MSHTPIKRKRTSMYTPAVLIKEPTNPYYEAPAPLSYLYQMRHSPDYVAARILVLAEREEPKQLVEYILAFHDAAAFFPVPSLRCLLWEWMERIGELLATQPYWQEWCETNLHIVVEAELNMPRDEHAERIYNMPYDADVSSFRLMMDPMCEGPSKEEVAAWVGVPSEEDSDDY